MFLFKSLKLNLLEKKKTENLGPSIKHKYKSLHRLACDFFSYGLAEPLTMILPHHDVKSFKPLKISFKSPLEILNPASSSTSFSKVVVKYLTP